MIRAMDALGVVHDASHLSEKAFWQLLERTDRPVIASHSNCRALCDPSGTNERHLTDDQIRAIGERGGVVGINLVSNFLDPSATREPPRRAGFQWIVRHVEHVCEVMGRRTGVALGSDADGGFSREWLPDGIDGPGDFDKVAIALGERGWSPDEVAGFRVNNWARFFASYPAPTRVAPATA